ncbi:MAG TPA: substrate-binding domain-containing protein [Smithella sp.]|nr:substrate-binding domain-containing protein [Smithella sp.]
MKLKNIFRSFVTGAAMLAIAGTASATTYDINIYGASAQFTFWNSVASPWIKAQTGCSTDTPVQYTFDGNNKITRVTCTGGDTYNIRVSSKASFDGILALKGDATYATVGTTAEACSAGDPGDPGASLRGYYRKMVDETTCSGTTCSGLKCVRVTVGASDVAGASFKQSSLGNQHGSTGSVIYRGFNGISTTGINSSRPFVVPFAFYANTQNAALNTAMNNNITRMMVILLFSGQIDDWNELGTNYPDLHTSVCLRHAGSGTHSTLDFAIMRGNGWGGTLAAQSNVPGQTATTVSGQSLAAYDNTMPDLYFNDTTGDELGCINSYAGAIGYADADKEVSLTNHTVNGYANIQQIAYQGEYPSADAIANGRYDFWTNEWAYKDPTLTTPLLTAVNSLLSYVSGHIPTSEQPFWMDQNAMTFEKATDQAYPQR